MHVVKVLQRGLYRASYRELLQGFIKRMLGVKTPNPKLYTVVLMKGDTWS